MIHDDYLMRMLEEFISALIRVLLIRKREQRAVPAELGELASRYLGLDLELLRSLPAEAVQQLLTSSGEPDYLRRYMAAELLREASEGPDGRDKDLYRKAIHLYRSALPLLRDLENTGVKKRLAELRQQQPQRNQNER
ncbi:hypothetical protein JXO52_10800 [bacterium]|nr:hypothetical protein [bacterium]